MVLVKVLGFIDLVASITLLGMIFSIDVPFRLMLVLGALLFMKGLFILTGDLFSILDLGAAVVFFVGIFFTPATFILWIFSLFLMSKGVASFL
ncbi:hypothetical protein J4423_01995 [Candidatus Pacearchaeota archaeon]|nr:hypothetical protein [Candidatus Pacearchaeota archaeon]